MRVFGISLLAAILCTACSFSVDYNNTAFTCKTNAECPDGLQCSAGRCATTGTTGCQADVECKDGEVCQNSACVPKSTGCTANSECGPAGYCLEKQCYQGAPGNPCSETVQCQAGHVCVDAGSGKQCLKQCSQNGDCTSAQTCKPSLTGGDAVCVTACNPIDQTGCTNSQACVLAKGSGFCQAKRGAKLKGQLCDQDADCELQLYCRPVKGYEKTIRRCTNVCNTDNNFGCSQTGQICLALADEQGFGFCQPLPTIVKQNEICVGDLECDTNFTCTPEPNQNYGRCRSQAP